MKSAEQDLSTELKKLYGSLLLNAVSGPDAGRMRQGLGEPSKSLFDALYDRYRAAVRLAGYAAWLPDAIDWAAMRLVIPITLRVAREGEFRTITGHSFEALTELGRHAVAAIREFRTPPEGVSYQIGDCLVVLPARYAAVGRYVVAVPAASSWDKVVPPCARGRREDFMTAMHAETGRAKGGYVLEELQVTEYGELVRYVAKLNAAFRRGRRRPGNAGQRSPDDRAC